MIIIVRIDRKLIELIDRIVLLNYHINNVLKPVSATE